MAARYRSSRRRAAGPPSASRSRWRPRCSAQARVRFWSRRGPRRRGLAGGQPGNIGIHVAGSSRCQPKALLCVLGGAGATAYKWFVRKPAAQAAVPDDRSLMHTARFTRPLAAAAGLAALVILAAASAGSATASSAKHDAAVHTHPAILLPGGNPIGSESGSTQHSNNWAGYAAFPQNSGGSFRYVQATFTVPAVNCAVTADAFSVHWVGLDGFTTKTAEQAGIEADCNGPTPTYSAWWETYPALPIETVSSGQLFNMWKPCGGPSCQNRSAEVISEAPAAASTLPLANFGIIIYVNIHVTDKSKQRGGIASPNWNHDKIILVNGTPSHQTLATPGGLFGSRAFSNTWKRES